MGRNRSRVILGLGLLLFVASLLISFFARPFAGQSVCEIKTVMFVVGLIIGVSVRTKWTSTLILLVLLAVVMAENETLSGLRFWVSHPGAISVVGYVDWALAFLGGALAGWARPT